MHILIAPDSFKGSLSALEAAIAIKDGIRKAAPFCKCVLLPAADGGEGTMQSLVDATTGTFVHVDVENPIGQLVNARYGVLGDVATCVIELAEASGLTLLTSAEQQPLVTSTFGTGQLIRHALDSGYRHFLIGLGGSATNDGGAGILQALGMQLLDSDGQELARGGAALQQLQTIVTDEFDSRIAESSFQIVADVTNPLVGNDGASFVFGPQKGASIDQVILLENSLSNFADILENHTSFRLHDKPSTGAAGGAGAAFYAFFPSELKPGIELVLNTLHFDEHLRNADLVITGEGRTDSQTLFGKTPFGIAQAAQKANVPVLLISGSITTDSQRALADLFAGTHAIAPDYATVVDAITDAKRLLTKVTKQAVSSYLSL